MLDVCCGAAAKRLAVHEVPTLLPAWVPDGFAAFNPYGMGRHQARAPAAGASRRHPTHSDAQPMHMTRLPMTDKIFGHICLPACCSR